MSKSVKVLPYNLHPLVETLAKLFPHAHCELVYRNIYELAVSVILSAQTTDQSVNRITPALFQMYPDLDSLAAANARDVATIIKSIGLYRVKSLNIIAFARAVIADFHAQIPQTLEELVTLPGVGRKTANVILSEGHRLPGLAVDTHVERVAKRLGIVTGDATPKIVELALKDRLPVEKWGVVHQQMLFMGRYLCRAKNPLCEKCPFQATYCQRK